MRAATCADTAIQLFQVAGDIDVREAARKIKCPVLIVHPERDVNVPIDEGRLLASFIPHCRFVQLDTENHMPLADEPAWEKLVAEVRSFLAQPEDGLSTGHKCLPLGTLTPRERAVLERIAGSLCLSEKTVRNHITRVFDKICVEHRYQAIVLAREAGLGRASRFVNKR
jgi:DNA-binding CsgD family transcriptional regulator